MAGVKQHPSVEEERQEQANPYTGRLIQPSRPVPQRPGSQLDVINVAAALYDPLLQRGLYYFARPSSLALQDRHFEALRSGFTILFCRWGEV